MGKSYVYIVCCKDGTLYTGSTTNIAKRLAEHNKGAGAKYTRGRFPVSLVYLEEVDNWGSALRRERAIKKMAKPRKIELISRSDLNGYRD